MSPKNTKKFLDSHKLPQYNPCNMHLQKAKYIHTITRSTVYKPHGTSAILYNKFPFKLLSILRRCPDSHKFIFYHIQKWRGHKQQYELYTYLQATSPEGRFTPRNCNKPSCINANLKTILLTYYLMFSISKQCKISNIQVLSIKQRSDKKTPHVNLEMLKLIHE